MMRSRLYVVSSLVLALGMLGGKLVAGSTDDAKPDGDAYLLRYKFQPGQTLSWRVVQRGRVTTSGSGVTTTTETISKSVKRWDVKEVAEDGTAVFEHRVDEVEMWQKLGDAEPIRFNSKTDKEPPRVFRDLVERVGKPMTRFRMDDRGNVLRREALLPVPGHNNKGQITIPLPEKPIAVGHTWTRPHELVVPLETGGVTKVLTQQRFTLKGVKTGVATIAVATQILTPVHSPALEAKLIGHGAKGTVRFDIEAGRVLSQRMDLDKAVIGFRGADSRFHNLTRFTERFLPDRAALARRERP